MKKKKRILLVIGMLLLMLAIPANAQAAAFKISKSGVTTPSTIKKGSFFSMKGIIKGNQNLAKVVCTIYNKNGKICLQRFETKPYSKTYDLRRADPYLYFDRLAAGQYYYRVCVYNSKGTKKRVVSKKFTVKGSGQIKIVNPVPSANKTIKKGSAFAVSGKITSTKKLASVTAKILNSKNKTVYSKTVKPKTTSYNLKNSTLDAAMQFDRLAAGKYTFRVSAVDSEGLNVTVIQRTITVQSSGSSNSSSNVSPGSTGGNPYTGNSTYLNYGGTVTKPASFTARTSRPAAGNAYYYNGTKNIYYKYNSLAPTGKVYYGKMYVTGNCTWYACGRAMEIVAQAGGSVSKVQAIFGGDPVGIYNTNVNLGKFKYGTTPKIGALAIFNYGASGDAHIAVVENIINGVPYVSESGYSVSETAPNAAKSNIIFKYQSIYNWAGGRRLVGYIYLI